MSAPRRPKLPDSDPRARPWKQGRKARVGAYPPVLTREALDLDHKAVLSWIAKFHKENGYAPAMREVGRGLTRSAMWTRDAVQRLKKSGFLRGGDGQSRTLRCATPSEYAAGAVARWEAWVSELPPSEVELLRLALGGGGADFSQLASYAPAGTAPRDSTVGAVGAVEDFSQLHEEEHP
jgi:hypothetical protein